MSQQVMFVFDELMVRHNNSHTTDRLNVEDTIARYVKKRDECCVGKGE